MTLEAKRLQVPVIRINPQDFKVENGAAIATGALEALEQLNTRLQNQPQKTGALQKEG